MKSLTHTEQIASHKFLNNSNSNFFLPPSDYPEMSSGMSEQERKMKKNPSILYNMNGVREHECKKRRLCWSGFRMWCERDFQLEMERKNYNNVQVIFIRVETEAKRRKKNIKKTLERWWDANWRGVWGDEMLREAKKSEKNIIESRNNFPTLAAASASHFLSTATLLFFMGGKFPQQKLRSVGEVEWGRKILKSRYDT